MAACHGRNPEAETGSNQTPLVDGHQSQSVRFKANSPNPNSFNYGHGNGHGIGKSNAESQLKILLAKADSREEFERKLNDRGMTLDGLRTNLTQDATALAALTRKLGVTVSDAEAKAYYDEHPQNSLSKDNKAEFESVEAEIKDFLSKQKNKQLAPPYLNKLYNDANVQILDADLK